MVNRIVSFVSALVLGVMLGACATPGTQSGEAEIRSGVIEQLTQVELPSNHHAGIGAVVGGLAGLGLGSLIGDGTGRDVAMVLGTVGGAYAGNVAQKKYEQPVAGLQVIVRTGNGVLVSVTQPFTPDLFKGQRVYIEGNGDGARVIPR